MELNFQEYSSLIDAINIFENYELNSGAIIEEKEGSSPEILQEKRKEDDNNHNDIDNKQEENSVPFGFKTKCSLQTPWYQNSNMLSVIRNKVTVDDVSKRQEKVNNFQKKARHIDETPEERCARLEDYTAKRKKQLSKETEEQRRARLKGTAKRMREYRARMTEEERQKMNEANNERKKMVYYYRSLEKAQQKKKLDSLSHENDVLNNVNNEPNIQQHEISVEEAETKQATSGGEKTREQRPNEGEEHRSLLLETAAQKMREYRPEMEGESKQNMKKVYAERKNIWKGLIDDIFKC